jgi:hypothetical protein
MPTKVPTARHYRQLGRYIRHLADVHLELRDWHLTVQHAEPPGGDCHGWCFVTYGRKRAMIRVANDWWDEDPTEQRHIVVHELLHIHLDTLDSFHRNALPELVGRSAAIAAQEDNRERIELIVDVVADALARHLPTPAEFAAGKR